MSNRIPTPEIDMSIVWPPDSELSVDDFCRMSGRSRDDAWVMVGPKWRREPSPRIEVKGQMGLFG